jgi:hypothetical protein
MTYRSCCSIQARGSLRQSSLCVATGWRAAEHSRPLVPDHRTSRDHSVSKPPWMTSKTLMVVGSCQNEKTGNCEIRGQFTVCSGHSLALIVTLSIAVGAGNGQGGSWLSPSEAPGTISGATLRSASSPPFRKYFAALRSKPYSFLLAPASRYNTPAARWESLLPERRRDSGSSAILEKERAMRVISLLCIVAVVPCAMAADDEAGARKNLTGV